MRQDGPITRRALGALALAAMPLGAIAAPSPPSPSNHLQARPRAAADLIADPRTPGLRHLGLDRQRDAVLFTPKGLDYSKPVPLIVSMHGFGGSAFDGLGWYQRAAGEHGFLLLSPPSRGETWNVDLGPIGPDAAFIDRALDWVFARFPIDPAHLAISGMSDGGSYALCMGLQNGELFSDVLAFSPLRLNAPDAQGRARFFISTGRADELALLANTERMVSQLKGLGYDVLLDIHDKGHVVTRRGVDASLTRFLG
ncbi:MAG: putative serine esterase [Caulobacter sp.]|nr:putative serine esterase [Caulobacter sp.]